MAFAAPSPLGLLPHSTGFARRHAGAIVCLSIPLDSEGKRVCSTRHMVYLQTQQQ